jgi:DNA-directed RNA polymerase subunit RPC12/RpoP
MWAGIVFVLAITIPTGVWFAIRLRRAAKSRGCQAQTQTGPEVATVSFACSGCGKTLRSRTTLAAKKVRCPQCGTAVRVPESKERSG